MKVAKICSTYSDCGYKASEPWQQARGEYYGITAVAPSVRTTFITNDGILYVLRVLGGTGSSQILSDIFIDINNSKGPNRMGRDVFIFVRDDKGIRANGIERTMGSINSECSKITVGNHCAAKIIRDGWKIKDDYPW